MSAGSKPGRWLAIAASLVVVATVVAAILAMGSPAQQRELRMDARRVQDLQRIAHAVDAYHATHKAMPADMATLAAQPGWGLATADPASGQPYDYAISGERGYRLCAVFDTDTATAGRTAWAPDDWNHGAGRHCFSREVTTAGRANAG